MCDFIPLLGLVASWHVNNSLVSTHACKAYYGVLKNLSMVIDLRAPISDTNPRWGSPDAVLQMQYQKQELGCGYFHHQPIILLVCFVALLGQLPSLGLEMHKYILLPQSSLSTPFS
jgi:hypothetical protein